jgi:uncharacterized membrane protein
MRVPLTLSPRARRVLQAVLFEALAVIAVGPALAWRFDEPAGSSFALALLLAAIALGWSLVFNAWFERWEAGRARKGRSWRRRLLHGLGFEGGLVLALVPVMAAWLHTSLWTAFVADLGVTTFYLLYGIAFTWTFDKLFGLPDSARPQAGAGQG